VCCVFGQQIEATISTAWKIFRDELFPYKMLLSYSLLDDGTPGSYSFAREFRAELHRTILGYRSKK
jgi:hypothetical protein